MCVLLSRQALARVFKTVEDRGVQVNSSAAAAALKELPGIKWETKESAAIGCLEEYYRARESPEVGLSIWWTGSVVLLGSLNDRCGSDTPRRHPC